MPIMPPIARIMPFAKLLHWIEVWYAIIIVIICILIIQKTKELYQLTNHKGIKYFRNTFFYFAIAYALQIVFPFTRMILGIDLFISRPLVGFLLLYVGTMAVLSLTYSVLYKRYKHVKPIYLHLIAIAIAFATIQARGRSLALIIQAILLIYAVLTSYIDNISKQNKTYLIYLLLFAIWIVNTLAFTLPRFLVQAKIGLYIISIPLFLIILTKVVQRTTTPHDKKT